MHQRLFRSVTVQQLLQQTQKGIKKLFEAFATGGTLNQKGWGRLSLFANLAPSPQMLCFFKQIAGSNMDEAAFEAALFQLAIALYNLDIRTSSEETVGRSFSLVLSHCLLDDPKALRDALHAFQSTGKQLLPFIPQVTDELGS